MQTINKAGAIIISQKDPTFIALLYRGKQDDWSFPKGHVEEGEEILDTTQREILEETGLLTRFISEPLPDMEYQQDSGGHVIVSMFIVRSENDSLLKTEFEGDRIDWVKYDEVVDRLSHKNTKEYYVKILPKVEFVIYGIIRSLRR